MISVLANWEFLPSPPISEEIRILQLGLSAKFAASLSLSMTESFREK